MSWRRTAVLARWLGPWSGPADVPGGVVRRPVVVEPEAPGDRAFSAWFYAPDGPGARGAYLVTPGLHFLGPDDPRMDRFCRVLAAGGVAVLSPSLPDPRALLVTERTPGDLERAFDTLLRQPEVPDGTRPAVFSISFGSLPALRLAAGERCRARARELVLFGGYADFAETVRFALTGEVDGRAHARPDPLNRPVAYLNVLHAIPGAPADPAPLVASWLRFCEETWGLQEMKDGGWREVAARLERDVPESMRELFRLGVGLDDGTGRSRAVAEAALASLDTAFADPSRGGLDGIACPVHLVHGAGDDVIPSNQLGKLLAILPKHVPVTGHTTGLYGHADRAGLPAPTALAREIATMLRVVRTLARAPG